MKKIFENAIWWSGVVTVGLVLGISLQFVRAWTEPTEAPPGGNVGAPINTGDNLQKKIGTFLSNYLGTNDFTLYNNPDSNGDGVMENNISGYVLTADAYGHATWQPSTGGGSLGHKKLFTADTADKTWTAPAGVTEVTVTAIGGGGGGSVSYWGDGAPYFGDPGNCGGGHLNHFYGGGGGSGGMTRAYSMAVTPGEKYTVDIGDGGACDSQHERAGSGASTRFLLGASEKAHADGGQGGTMNRYYYVGGSAGAGCSPEGNGGNGTADAGGAGGKCPASMADFGSYYGNGGSGGCGSDQCYSGKSGALEIDW